VTRRAPVALRLLTLACCALVGAAWPGPGRADTLRLGIGSMAFADVPASARVGDTVEWSNRDIVAHTATARDGSFDVVILPGKTGRTVLRKVGRATFYCRYHPSMAGKIDIRPG
jgi:plastocyanin